MPVVLRSTEKNTKKKNNKEEQRPQQQQQHQTLMAVSAFNDNGIPSMIRIIEDEKKSDTATATAGARNVLRSDFFGGLGWMMPRYLWEEVKPPKWPDGFWDDWLREPSQQKGRECLRPEVSFCSYYSFF